MRWSKPDFKEILKDLRSEWYQDSAVQMDFFGNVVYVSEQNQFFDRQKKMFLSPEAYQNTYSHLDGEAKKEALEGGRVIKVDRLDYAPKNPAVFVERGITFGNAWCDSNDVDWCTR